MRRLLTAAPLLMLLTTVPACETTNRALSTMEHVLSSSPGRVAVDIAEGKDPKRILKERAEAYQRDPEALLRDLRAAQRISNSSWRRSPATSARPGARKK